VPAPQRDAVPRRRLCVKTPSRSSRFLVAVGATAAAVALACPPAARASLGGGVDSVTADRAHLSARLSSQVLRSRTVHVLTLPNGAERRELARSDGTVFALTWQGRSRPDLRQLMGPSFATFEARVGGPGARRTRRPLDMRETGLVVHAGGHGGAFWGYAYLPQLAPADFTMAELKSGLPQ
jgi:hypothetical protein